MKMKIDQTVQANILCGHEKRNLVPKIGKILTFCTKVTILCLTIYSVKKTYKLKHCRKLSIGVLCQHRPYIMGLDATKPIFRVSDKASLKPVSSATYTS